jgi:HPt (histidine-containing phosphotransfer) domain-containing protein
MAKSKEELLKDGLKRLMVAARPEMMRRLKVVKDAAMALQAGPLTEEMRKAAHAEAHKLAGALGTYGFMDASRAAHELEVLLVEPKQEDAKPMKRYVLEVMLALENK